MVPSSIARDLFIWKQVIMNRLTILMFTGFCNVLLLIEKDDMINHECLVRLWRLHTGTITRLNNFMTMVRLKIFWVCEWVKSIVSYFLSQ